MANTIRNALFGILLIIDAATLGAARADDQPARWPIKATPGAWQGAGRLEGHGSCAGDFSMSFAVSETGALAGKLITTQGSHGFPGEYALRGQLDLADGRTLNGAAAGVFVMRFTGWLEGTVGEGQLEFSWKANCAGLWTAQRGTGGE